MSEIITSKAKWLELIGEIAVILFFPQSAMAVMSFSMNCQK